jgi:uncharacterized protein (UPF0305 family)
MDNEFINVYIEILMTTLDDYIKKDVMNRTHMEMAKRQISSLEAQISELKKENENASINKKKV